MSKIVLSKTAYIHNLTQISNKIGSKERIIAVLKDDAYGHGAVLMAGIASDFGIKWACVKSIDEAIEISSFFKNIIILSHIPNGKENDEFIYAINDLSGLEVIKSGVRVHLAIDTMMHRNGISISEIKTAFDIAKNRSIKICGAYTHFRSSDEMSGDYYVQKDNFLKAKIKLRSLFKESGVDKPMFHSHNSAAIERTNGFEDEFVRAGIVQFGYSQFDESLNLKRVLSLWADRISKRVLKTGQSVGYGGVFTAKKDINIATYDLGYGDGLLRYNGKGDLHLANGEKILGKMSMDSFSCADFGDQICVFDDARVWAKFFDTISYDILVKLSSKIKRVVV
ncbi:alanine racemase [Campylobacter fetus]|uniref:Alanine racemase n=1 Tax=Campylobacter fetus subsp. testudinum TaxID=1507806 RepID=A0AAX0HCK4_CAMFE|nr:alanine racemase [Campylobacter fetus]EAI4322681.1 alanine racemase [Campylobacter fetus]EAI4391611.1 alanine racemase [Campylobacter fetus]EAK0829245.1 alanine racemase [Campylobacter fetus]MPB72183.1 alanine racemase [Campylobacter fetus]MPB78033.1 alanine racemase [Campylobacter fetus]